MEKQYIFWDTGAGCLVGVVVLLLAAALIAVGIILDLDDLALLAITLVVIGPVAAIGFRLDRRAARRRS